LRVGRLLSGRYGRRASGSAVYRDREQHAQVLAELGAAHLLLTAL
jgi:hypothetical protein